MDRRAVWGNLVGTTVSLLRLSTQARWPDKGVEGKKSTVAAHSRSPQCYSFDTLSPAFDYHTLCLAKK